MLTRSITTALTSACLLLPFLAGAQDPAPKKTEPAPESPTQLLDGAWQLELARTGLRSVEVCLRAPRAPQVGADRERGPVTGG